MTPVGKTRRACALLKVGRGQPARPMVEKRPLHGYWAILMPHFRGVLLPPQNRSDESIQWSWTETAADDAVSATELATIRKRLAGAQQSLADSLEDTSGFAAKAATVRATKDRMEEVVSALVALPDAALAGFVARTDRGMLLHSWGLRNPLPVQYLDADFELAGRVLVAGAPASGQDVLLVTAEGLGVAQTVTDAEGCFEFSKIVSGSYRVRAVSRPPEVLFPEKGEVVELLGSSITNLEICNEDRARKVIPLSRAKTSGRSIRAIVSISAVLLAVAVYCFWPGKGVFSTPSTGSEQSAWEVNSAPRTVAQHGAERPDQPNGRSAQSAINAKVAVQQAPKTPGAKRSPHEPLPEGRHSRAANIIVAQATSSLPAEQAGLPAGTGGIPGGAPGARTGGAHGGSQGGGHSASGGGGNASGASGVGADGASPSAAPAASPSTSPSQVPAPSGPANMPPSAGRPQGSSAPEDASTSASASEASARSSSSTVSDSQPAEVLVATNPSVANIPDKAAAAAETKSDAPSAGARSPVSDLPDSDTSVPEEIGDSKARDKSKSEAPSGESEDLRSPIQQGSIPEQAGAAASNSDSSLEVRMMLRSSPWRRLLLRDAIVPTLPTRVGQDDALSDLSSRVLAEKQASIPRTLQDGRIVVGVRIEFSALIVGPPPRWDVVNGAAPLIAIADENAAEIGWREEAPHGAYVLNAADGRMIASISADPQGGVRVSSAGMVSSWPWVGVECARGEAERFDWRVLGTSVVPSSWTKNNRWMDARGRRLDLRLLSEKDETVVHSLAIVDVLTGWALTSKVEQQQKRRR